MSTLGIVAETENGKVSFFDTETLLLTSQLDTVGNDPLGVAITPDGNTAIVTTFYSQKINNIDITSYPPTLATSLDSLGNKEDVDITPDSKFAVITDGGPGSNPIYSYEISTNTVVSQINANLQAVAVSPNGNGLILTAEYYQQKIRIFTIDSNGILTDTTTEIPVSISPINITFTPDGNFAFIGSDTSSAIVILNTSDINNITVAGQTTCSVGPQTIVVSQDGTKVYALCNNNVDIFDFTTVPTPTLTLDLSFPHYLVITPYFGIDQMAINNNEDKLFISADKLLNVFQTDGTHLCTIDGICADGGVAIVPAPKSFTRGILLH